MTKVVTVCTQCSERQREKFEKARVNGGSKYDFRKDPHKSLRCRWQTRIIW